MTPSLLARVLKVSIVALAGVLALQGVALAAPTVGARATTDVLPQIVVGPIVAKGHLQPPPSNFCIANIQIACYAPSDMRAEYDFGPELAAGHDGTGQTIVIFDSYGSPTIK